MSIYAITKVFPRKDRENVWVAVVLEEGVLYNLEVEVSSELEIKKFKRVDIPLENLPSQKALDTVAQIIQIQGKTKTGLI